MQKNNNFSDEQWNMFTEELKDVIDYIEKNLTYEHPVLSINENYFLLAIFENKNCLAYKIIDALLSSTAINLIHDAYFRIVSKGQISVLKPNRVVPFDSKFNDLINEGIEEMKKMGDEKLSTIHIMMTLTNPENEHSSVQKIMKSAGLYYSLLVTKLSSLKNETPEIVEDNPNPEQEKTSAPKPKAKINGTPFEILFDNAMPKNVNGQYMSSYCINLNKKAKEGKIDPVIGRDKEIKQITNIFNRRRKSNAVVVGDKGSGKTAICETLAWLIVNDKAPYSLRDKTILKLDISSMMAGTTYRGMFEERAKGLFNELQKNPKCILFIDDFHTHSQKRDLDSSTDITPYLKEAIDNNSVCVIATCTPKGFHKKFDYDQSLNSKFQRIDLKPLSEDEIKTIIMNVKSTYEKYHSIKISEEIVDLSISLCKRYVTDRDMPDSVIDLIDEVGACVSKKYEEPNEMKELKKELIALGKSKKNAIKESKFDEVDNISDLENKKKNQIKELGNKNSYDIVNITNEMIFETMSERTGIPIQNLTDESKKDLSKINERLKRTVIGQDDAIDKICKTIKRKRLGVHSGKGTAILCQGKTGCGKTYLAKKLAEELFGSESAMIRFDMSEYSDKTSVNKLIGSNAGYVGYEEGGLLTEAIKNKKHCILLLDEIEKADNEIYNIFLQVFDEGFLTDNTGQKVDFRNVVILLTSNVGAKEVSMNGNSIGFGQSKESDNDKINSILDKELKRKFAPEFLNRLDNIIYFNPLDNDSMKKIIRLEIDKSVNRFKNIGYEFSYDDSVVEHILNTIKDESEYGARPVIRAIQNEIEDPLTDTILDGDCNEKMSISFEDDKIIIKEVV